jgi:hypothetical protein
MGMPKEYTGTLRLGEGTPSLDSETAVEERLPWEHLTDDDLAAAASKLTGDIEQVGAADGEGGCARLGGAWAQLFLGRGGTKVEHHRADGFRGQSADIFRARVADYRRVLNLLRVGSSWAPRKTDLPLLARGARSSEGPALAVVAAADTPATLSAPRPTCATCTP